MQNKAISKRSRGRTQLSPVAARFGAEVHTCGDCTSLFALNRVNVASLIHDGVLVKASNEHIVDIEERGEHCMRETTQLKSAIETLDRSK